MNIFVSAPLRVLVFCLGCFVTLLPRKLELELGKGMGLLVRAIGYRKKVVKDNLKHCFRELPEDERERIYKKFYTNFGILLLELCHYFSPIPGHYKRYIEKNTRMHGLEYWDQARANGKGTLFVASHLANWEMMVSCGSLNGIIITMITKNLKPKWLHRIIEGHRQEIGIKAAYEPRTLPVILRALRDNEAVGFVMDQYAGPPIGIEVPFFGVKVGTLAAVGTLVERTGATVITASTHRDAQGIVHVNLEPPLELGNLVQDVEKTTALLAQKVEGWVRKFPDQWLWTHRRFKKVVWPEDFA